MFEEMQILVVFLYCVQNKSLQLKCFIPYNHHETGISFIPLQSHQYGATYTI